MPIVIFIIALIVSSIIVNGLHGLFMNFIGADFMFFNWTTKLIIIVVVAVILFGLVAGLMGLI